MKTTVTGACYIGEQIDEAHDRVVASDVRYRLVIDTNSL